MANESALEIVEFGNPVLRKKARPLAVLDILSLSTRTLIRNMFLTMDAIGVGIAAPQVGTSLQLAVVEIKPLPHRPNVKPFPKTVIINPRIVSHSKALEKGYEGCLSLPDVRGEVPRYKSITVEFQDEHGKQQQLELSGFTARVFQHEIDHLQGVLFVDRMRDMRTLMSLAEYQKQIGKK